MYSMCIVAYVVSLHALQHEDKTSAEETLDGLRYYQARRWHILRCIYLKDAQHMQWQDEFETRTHVHVAH
jgi:hypothetical protein